MPTPSVPSSPSLPTTFPTIVLSPLEYESTNSPFALIVDDVTLTPSAP